MNAHLSHAESDAQDAVLSNAGAFTKWLAGQCNRHGCAPLGYVSSDRTDLALRVDAMTVPQLVSLSLYPVAVARDVAMAELSQRYLDDNEHLVAQARDELQAEIDIYSGESRFDRELQ